MTPSSSATEDGSVRENALANLEARCPVDNRLGLAIFKIVNARAPVALQREDVPKAFGGDKGGRVALSFEDRVRRDRRSMGEVVDFAESKSAFNERIEGAFIGIAGRARYLQNADTFSAYRDEIREGPADLNSRLDFLPNPRSCAGRTREAAHECPASHAELA